MAIDMQARVPRRPLHGVLLLDKPRGITSNAALQRARRAFNAAKAGHTGTLDPLASGLLPLCFGDATKFAHTLIDAHKRYLATVRFGERTSTLDAEGAVIDRMPVAITQDELQAALAAFTGPIEQVPPAYSALKFQGRNYYDYARAGIEIERSPRKVEIHRLELIEWRTPDAFLDVTCSKGTYIRSLAADLGERLGCGAHLAGLRRTRSGGFDVAEAIDLACLEAMAPSDREVLLRPPESLLTDLLRIELDGPGATRFRQGAAVAVGLAGTSECAVFGQDGLLGLGNLAEGLVHPRRLVAQPAASASDP